VATCHCLGAATLVGAVRLPRWARNDSKASLRGAQRRSNLVWASNRRERAMRLGWQLDPDRVAGPHLALRQDHSHNAGLADQAAVLVAIEGRRHQPRPD